MWNSTTSPTSQANTTNEPNIMVITSAIRVKYPEKKLFRNSRSNQQHCECLLLFVCFTCPDTDSSNDSGTESLTWISWFCSLTGHEYFAEVAEDFIEDDFNLTGLNSMVPFYKEALEMILDVEPEEETKVPDVSIVENSAELLYGLIHQRYIITRQGLQQMVEKYESTHFGTCPRFYCQSCPVVPCGRNDIPALETVKLFCPNCLDLYTPPSSRYHNIDGAYFGTTFPHLLFQLYPDLLPRTQNLIYEPKIFGFKVNERSRSGPRMQWLRMRPSENENADDPGADSDLEGGDDQGGNDPHFFNQGTGENNGTQFPPHEGSFRKDKPFNTDISNKGGNNCGVQENPDGNRTGRGLHVAKKIIIPRDRSVNRLKEAVSSNSEGTFAMAPLAKLIPFLMSPTIPTTPTSPTTVPSPTESTASLASISTDITASCQQTVPPPPLSPSSITSSSSSSLQSLLEKLPTSSYLSGNSFSVYASYFSQGERPTPREAANEISKETVGGASEIKKNETSERRVNGPGIMGLGFASVTEMGRDFYDKWTNSKSGTNADVAVSNNNNKKKLETREVL
ncbi:6280_t:CDS:2 [Ambispora gerdemannii]|uniref:Casein kinase II subunit beta n=1 Tax=Ambispora gerdemannii TaxID=144530 RepID=A0A9N8VXR7_9GLOM|nr:6280_t:CDS:2 [Ambispora gerdemannii]